MVGAVLLGPAAGHEPRAEAATVCSRFSAGVSNGVVQNDALVELSGLAASRKFPGVLWAHNDSGGLPELFAMGSGGKDLGRFPVAGATAIDWEDIAAGPGPVSGVNYLYIGDIGDNAATRDHVTVYRVPEPASRPAGTGSTLTGAIKVNLRYAIGPRNAESLIVDPRSHDLYILTKPKDGAVKVLRAPASSLVDGATVVMQQVASFQSAPADSGYTNRVTAADVSPDGSIVLVRTYRLIIAFVRPAGQSLQKAFSSARCNAPQRNEPVGEAIAFSADGAFYFTSSERAHQPIYKFAVTPHA